MDLYMSGMSGVEISRTLQISPELVSLDLKHVREESRQLLDHVIEKELPLAFTKARRSLQFLQTQSLQIWKNAKTDSTKLSALQLFGDAQEKEFTLVSNSHVLDEALRFVSGNQLNQILSKLKEKENDIPINTTTTKENTGQ